MWWRRKKERRKRDVPDRASHLEMLVMVQSTFLQHLTDCVWYIYIHTYNIIINISEPHDCTDTQIYALTLLKVLHIERSKGDTDAMDLYLFVV